MYLVERTVAGEYLNKDGTTAADPQVADIYADVREAFTLVDAMNRGAEVQQLVPITVTRSLGTPVS